MLTILLSTCFATSSLTFTPATRAVASSRRSFPPRCELLPCATEVLPVLPSGDGRRLHTATIMTGSALSEEESAVRTLVGEMVRVRRGMAVIRPIAVRTLRNARLARVRLQLDSSFGWLHDPTGSTESDIVVFAEDAPILYLPMALVRESTSEESHHMTLLSQVHASAPRTLDTEEQYSQLEPFFSA